MKELSIEEKAQRYDEAIKYARYLINERCKEGTNGSFHRADLDKMFPTLKESEDEKIRKKLLALIEWSKSYAASGITTDDAKEMTAWLEKQGEQKPADKVEPKFKVGDIIRHKKHGFTCKIIAIDTEYRLSDCMGTHLSFDSQDAYELVEQKTTWSEEDKRHIELLISICEEELAIYKTNSLQYINIDAAINWLKSLKDKKKHLYEIQNIPVNEEKLRNDRRNS